MTRRAPEFWHNPHQRVGWHYRVAAALYQVGHYMRLRLVRPARVGVPVVCVGNVVAGGAGKTPTVATVVAWLQAHGKTPHILSRGYGGCVQGQQVQPHHSAHDVGDEPLLLARIAPCWVGADRRKTARLAMEAGADCLVMDDGFQNPSLYKDCSLVVVDGGYGLGNGRSIPAGPLRESVASAAKRAQAVLLIGRDSTGVMSALPRHLTYLRGTIVPHVPDALREGPLLAFCGIARPQKFYDTLHEQALDVVHTRDFADHHPYTHDELEALWQHAQQHHAQLVTTLKDWVRLDAQWQERVHYLPISLKIQPQHVLDALLAPLVA